jgi:SAM-dependent methyltransferase
MDTGKVYSPKEYWSDLARRYGDVDDSGLAPILHPQTPEWFNQVFDKLQFRSFRRALEIAEFPVGARLLDVGCGTGRWLRRHAELGFSPIGVDATFGMLVIARAQETKAPLVVGLASNLPFTDASFEGLSDITVVQHVPYQLQAAAVREMIRVLRPGGRLILLELIRGKGPHIFPRTPLDWIQEIESCGAKLIKCFGQEFLLPDRLFVRLAGAVSRRRGNHIDRVQLSLSAYSSQSPPLARRIYWKLRRFTVLSSACIEPLVARICPLSVATHAVFVFRKI